MKDKKPPRRWMKLDNAAKIYPASRSVGWMAVFRLSAELCDPIDPVLLAEAEKRAAARFPSLCQRLRRGFFWYYLEYIDEPPVPEEDVINPCGRFDFKKTGGYMFRVRYHENRIALEFFHVLTDGTGGLIFLKTLLAEYVTLRYGENVPRGDDIPDCGEAPKREELEDCYLKYARKKKIGRSSEKSYRQVGTKEKKGNVNVVTAMLSASELAAEAKRHGGTVTEYLSAALVTAFRDVQLSERPKKRRSLPVMICVPVNLRKFYGAKTVRNFAEFVNVGIDYSLGDYTFDETVTSIHHQMGLYVNEQYLNAKLSTNVSDEKNLLIRVVPLFIKNVAMKLAFRLNGDRTSATTLTNLGRVTLPDEMSRHITRLDFMLGALSRNPSAFASISYNGLTTVNMVRSVTECDVERGFARLLVRHGLKVKVESNRKNEG